jgi:protein gp37
MQKTSIGWTNLTWNPFSGCDKVSEGCKNCYAEPIAKRIYSDGFKFTIHAHRFNKPLGWREPRMIFVNSMSDLFHEQATLEVLTQLFTIMGRARQHRFQILTKRAQRLVLLAPSLEWHPNIWIGVSVENQARANQRIAYLSQVPAAVRWLSVEPLLERVDLDLSAIHWVVVGGESGPRHRPFDVAWARSVRDQCQEAGIPFFMKQLGGYPNKHDSLSDFPPDLQIQEWPSSK